MELVRGFFSGALLLHVLTVAAPLATLIVAGGIASWRSSLLLLALGLGATAATLELSSSVATSSMTRIEVGAPLPFARLPGGVDGVDRLAGITLLPANLLGDAIFWCSAAIVVGTLLRVAARGAVKSLGPITRRPQSA